MLVAVVGAAVTMLSATCALFHVGAVALGVGMTASAAASGVNILGETGLLEDSDEPSHGARDDGEDGSAILQQVEHSGHSSHGQVSGAAGASR